MKDVMSFLETKERKYPIAFNLNAMEEIQEAYGSVREWAEAIEASGEPKIKDLKKGFLIMINEGIDILNENETEKQPFVTDKQVGRILTEIGIAKATEQIKAVTINSVDDGESEKNE